MKKISQSDVLERFCCLLLLSIPMQRGGTVVCVETKKKKKKQKEKSQSYKLLVNPCAHAFKHF